MSDDIVRLEKKIDNLAEKWDSFRTDVFTNFQVRILTQLEKNKPTSRLINAISSAIPAVAVLIYVILKGKL